MTGTGRGAISCHRGGHRLVPWLVRFSRPRFSFGLPAVAVASALGVSSCAHSSRVATQPADSKSGAQTVGRPLVGYPGQRAGRMDRPDTVWARALIGPKEYFAQPNDWTCSASSYIMLHRALTGRDLPLSTVVARTGAVEGVGAENRRVVEALKMMGPGYEVVSGQTAAYPKGERVPRNVREAEKACEYETLVRLLREGFLVILNFREPVDHGGHYGVLQGLNRGAIRIADPYYGRVSVLPWKRFDFRTGYSDPVLHGWYVAVRPKPPAATLGK